MARCRSTSMVRRSHGCSRACRKRRNDAQPLDGSIAACFLTSIAVTDGAAISIEAKLTELSARVDVLATERDEYRKLYLQALETCRKLELGLVGAKRERLSGGDQPEFELAARLQRLQV